MKNWTNTKEFLNSIPAPCETDSYCPIAHSVFLNELQEEIARKGYIITEERYLSASNGQIITGNLAIKSDGTVLTPMINFTNSYNKMRSASVRASGMVLICKNGMMGATSAGSFVRKHTGNALEEMRAKIIQVVDSLEEEFLRLSKNIEEMKKIELDKTVIATLVGDMFINENLITSTQLGILSRELKYSENFKDGSLWSFYNNSTQSFKENHPLLYDKQMIKFHTYISDKFELTGHRGLYGKALEVVPVNVIEELTDVEYIETESTLL